MKVIIDGDDSKMIDNFTEIMFYITLQRIKNNNFELNKKKNSRDEELSLKEKRLSE